MYGWGITRRRRYTFFVTVNTVAFYRFSTLHSSRRRCSQFTAWVDAVIFVFSLENEASFNAVYGYYTKMAHYRNSAEIPLILVGTQGECSSNRNLDVRVSLLLSGRYYVCMYIYSVLVVFVNRCSTAVFFPPGVRRRCCYWPPKRFSSVRKIIVRRVDKRPNVRWPYEIRTSGRRRARGESIRR